MIRATLTNIIVISAFIFRAGFALASECPFDYPGVEPVLHKSNLSAIELCAPNGGFVTEYSESWRLPLFSVEHLTREHLKEHYSKGAKRVDSFRPDERIPANYRAELSDYAHAKMIDRGHLAPDADSWSSDSEYDTFVLSNMIPQASDNNRGLHAHIEAAVRHLTMNSRDLYVYTGPLFLEPNPRLMHQRIPIPDHIFKLVYNPHTNQAAAYVEKNDNGDDDQYQAVSAQELSRMAGIDFLPGKNPGMLDLPKPLENNREHHVRNFHLVMLRHHFW